jgi:hypothetical protein
MTTLTSRNHLVVFTVGTVTIPGAWKTVAGGGLTSENTKNRPGGMGQEETIPGVPTREDLTITREYNTARDAALVGPGGFFETAQKNGVDCAVTVQDLGRDAQPIGPAKVYRGTITSSSRADRDSESNEVDTLTVVLSVVA